MVDVLILAIAYVINPVQSENQPPWLTDVKKARESAIKEGKQCIIILNVDSSAL